MLGGFSAATRRRVRSCTSRSRTLARRHFSRPSPAVIKHVDVVGPSASSRTDTDGGEVQLHTTDGVLRFDALWLAHNCWSLRQEHTGQKLFPLSALTPSERTPETGMVRDAVLTDDGKSLEVNWASPLPSAVSTSTYNTQWLLDLALSRKRDRKPSPLRAAQKGSFADNRDSVTQVAFADLHRDTDAQMRWLQALHDHGLCLVTDVPHDMSGHPHDDGSGDSSIIQLGRLVAEPQKTLYGQDFDVRTEVQPINIAYTNAELDLHMDLPYYESPPGIQMLHCIENDKTTVKGGESLFMDVHHCAELFREEDPEGFQTLCEVPATFVKDHLERTHPAQMFCRRPHFEVDPTNGDLLAVFWSPNFEGPLLADVEDVRRYHRAYNAFAALLTRKSTVDNYLHEFLLLPGDAITFNQRRVLHGRRGFVPRDPSQEVAGVKRHLKGAYLNIDDFTSRYRVLRFQHQLSARGIDDTNHVGSRSR